MMRRPALLLTMLAAWSCSPPPEAIRSSVVLVTIDTLRADRLGSYGGNIATPNLDRLAREGSLFIDAMSQSPLTLPSHSSILTGTQPTYHGVKDNARFRLPDALDTLAEILKAEGYSTAAFVGGFPVHSRFGLSQGFDTYDESFEKSSATLAFAERRAEQVVAAASRWVENQTEGHYFLWVHLFDPHAPYDPPEPFRSQYSRSYDGEVAYVDQALGRLFSLLGEDVLTVVTADHGEGLGEHGEATHALFVYESTLKVPLIFRGPGVPRGVEVAETVRTVDILPTILDMMGLANACAACQGESLQALMHGDEAEPRTSYAETYFPRLNLGWSELRSIRQDGWKYIAAPDPELYELETDPGELQNLADDRPEKLRELAAELEAFESSTAGPIRSAPVRPDRETLTLLRSLGYISGEPRAAEGPLPDPKSRLPVWQGFREGMASVAKGEFEQAIHQFENILRQDDGLLLARSYLAGAYFERGQYAEAASESGKLLAEMPNDFEAALLLGRSLLRMGRAREAEQVLLRAADLDSISPDPHAELANLYLQAGAGAKARQSLALAGKRDSRAPSVLVVQGKLLLAEGKADQAEDSFRAAMAADPSDEDPRVQLANLLLGQRRLDEAAKIIQKGLAQRPESALLHMGLGHSRALAGRMGEAIPSFETALELAPESTLILNSLGAAYLETGATQKGLALFRRSLEKKPDQPQLKNILSQLRGQ